jgi:exosortase/archaeosortase family protein
MISVVRQDGATPPRGQAQPLSAVLDRGRLLAGLLVIGFVNGIVIRVGDAFDSRGLLDLVMNTFDISAIVWIALIVAIVFLLRSRSSPVRHTDQVVAASAAAAFLVPVAPLSWIALSGLAIYTLYTSPKGSFAHRGGAIVLAITVPMLWSRVAFSLLSDPILDFDAVLVGWTVGTERLGNTIGFSDGSGYLWIAPACSSLTNASLAVLCWVLFTQVFYRERTLGEQWWCALACLAVIALNVTRLSLIASYPEQQEVLHGPVGETVANWATLAAILGICALGVRHDLAAHR